MHPDLWTVPWGPKQPDLVATPDGFGLHCTIHRIEVLDALGSGPFTVLPGKSEDLSFCQRARAIGGTLAMSTRAMVAHVETATGLAFMPGMRPGRIVEGEFHVVDDARTDEEIVEAYRGNTRAARDYGERVNEIAHTRG